MGIVCPYPPVGNDMVTPRHLFPLPILLTQMILDWAIRRKFREVRKGIARSTSFWDYVAFRPIQKGLGGRVRCIITGSAPLDAKVMEFMRCATGAYVMEGEAETEVCGDLCELQIILS